MPTLTVSRDTGWADRARKYRVLVDDKEIGRVGEGEVLRHELEPGHHVLRAKIDWCGSRDLDFEIGESGCEVRLRSALRRSRVVLALFYVLFNPRGYVIAERVA